MVKTVAFFNPTKTECLTSSNKVKKPFHPSLIFNNVQLKEDETHKHLRVILSCNLSRNLHLDQIVFLKKGLLTSQYAAKIENIRLEAARTVTAKQTAIQASECYLKKRDGNRENHYHTKQSRTFILPCYNKTMECITSKYEIKSFIILL